MRLGIQCDAPVRPLRRVAQFISQPGMRVFMNTYAGEENKVPDKGILNIYLHKPIFPHRYPHPHVLMLVLVLVLVIVFIFAIMLVIAIDIAL